MIVSMTGYGKSANALSQKTLIVEIKTLNSKNLDLNLRMPQALREKETLIRGKISSGLTRGKVEVIVSLEHNETQLPFSINRTVLSHYFNDLKEVSATLNLTLPENTLSALLRLPDVLQSKEEDISGQDWQVLENTVQEAIDRVNEFRESEGAHLQKDICERIDQIRTLLSAIEPLEKKRIENLKERLLRSLKEIQESFTPDENRFEQELIYYLEKLDITEEKVRLQKHLDYFDETLLQSMQEGKKLGFIAQEIGREINTIGSKANDACIQKLVIQMKDELEKIKEQLLNVL